MPAVFAHALFGKKIYNRLDDDCKKTVDKYRKYYILGLQGPDILFFYRPFYVNKVNKTAVNIHHGLAADFIRHLNYIIDDYGVDSPECAYALGFMCHFMLDSTCHPVVLKEIDRTGMDHISIETEFEIALMKKCGKDPYHYDLRRMLPFSDDMAEHISNIYINVSPLKIKEAVWTFRAAKYMFSDRGGLFYKMELFFTRLPLINKLVYPHMICPKGYDTRESDVELEELLNSAVKETSEILMDLYDKNDYKNPRFKMDFYGKE